MSTAHASRYTVTELGPTQPTYGEHRMGMNQHGDVAWSELVGAHSQARLTWNGNAVSNLHSLAGSPQRSYAEDTNDARHVVGYTATSTRENHGGAPVEAGNAFTLGNAGSGGTGGAGGPIGTGGARREFWGHGSRRSHLDGPAGQNGATGRTGNNGSTGARTNVWSF